jgi:hypothetical protein
MWYLRLFRKSVEKIQILLKPTKITGILHEDVIAFMKYLAGFLLQWEMLQIKVVEKTKTHILFSLTFLRKSCRFWNNLEQYCWAIEATDNMTLARGIYWISKATRAQTRLRIHSHWHTHTLTHAHIHAYSYFVNASCYCIIRTMPVLLVSAQALKLLQLISV